MSSITYFIVSAGGASRAAGDEEAHSLRLMHIESEGERGDGARAASGDGKRDRLLAHARTRRARAEG